MRTRSRTVLCSKARSTSTRILWYVWQSYDLIDIGANASHSNIPPKSAPLSIKGLWSTNTFITTSTTLSSLSSRKRVRILVNHLSWHLITLFQRSNGKTSTRPFLFTRLLMRHLSSINLRPTPLSPWNISLSVEVRSTAVSHKMRSARRSFMAGNVLVRSTE